MQDVDSKPSALSAVACFHHEPLVSAEGLVARVEATAQSRVSPGLQPQELQPQSTEAQVPAKSGIWGLRLEPEGRPWPPSSFARILNQAEVC